MQELAFPDSFELIFVATAWGGSLSDASATSLAQHLRWGEQRFPNAHADRSPTFQINNVLQSVGGEAAWNKLRSSSSRTTVELGGTAYQLYLQPLVLDSGQPIELVVGGAVPRSTVVRDALALGAPLLGVLVFLVLLGVLGFPFVKLACLDPREHFCLRDIKLIYVSTGALLVLFTCASLALDGYIRWRLEADGGLAPLAQHLERHFLDEVEAIRDQLSSYDKRVNKMPAQPCDEWAVKTNWFQSSNPTPTDLPWPPKLNLKAVQWIGPDGQQIWKSTADAVSGKIRVGQRVYFRAVQDDNLFKARGHDPAFFLTPDRSIADGKFYTFISMRSRISPTRCGRDQTGSPVVAATAQLLSLDRQPLPAGYGFAVINREGRVLYHSDGRLSLRENLYEELSDAARVRAMTYAGDHGGFDIRYRERPHRFYLHPIALSRAADHDESAPAVGSESNAGFYLAVFRDTSVEQALLGHVFVVALAGPMALSHCLCDRAGHTRAVARRQGASGCGRPRAAAGLRATGHCFSRGVDRRRRRLHQKCAAWCRFS
jgi:hypothetical protein